MNETLDKNSIVPLYAQIMEYIEENISDGTYQPGTKLPPEYEMADMFNVSIITVRTAISNLIDKGLVARKRGKGTFVTKPKLTKDVKKLYSFSNMCERMGIKPGGKTLKNQLTRPGDKILNELGLHDDEEVVYVERLRTADGEPVAIEKNYFPLKYKFLLQEDLDDNSLFEILFEKAGIMVNSSEKRIELCKATPSEAKLLQVSKQAPLLLIKSVTFSNKNEPLYYGLQIFNGDRFSFYVYESTVIAEEQNTSFV
jgi:GntR family transcriptional regulator